MSAPDKDHAAFLGTDGQLYVRDADGTTRHVPVEVDSEGNLPTHEETDSQRSARAVATASGNRRALLIGINYTGLDSGQLRGCINDVENMSQFLVSHFHYPPGSITVLRDDDPAKMPTKDNILRAMNALVAGAAPGDSLFFHYSGHGSQTRDWTFLEEDGQNEVRTSSEYGNGIEDT
eukprot:TRINITY_DN1744_c0_g1_i2.p3 TRINITY_DN1744_c0_g1~~TRINITY_DN1744_c0_g1_i2.p3  ORF type:complete len:177 (+),score=33.87 TRINITY_DN1744_c0_g1_i2:163-693(+)